MPAGIDIGKYSIHLCITSAEPPRRWPVHVIDMANPQWRTQLDAIGAPTTVALELTGYHYSAAIVRYLEAQGHTVYEVSADATGSIRKLHISPNKNDHDDARALALIARKVVEGHIMRNVHKRNPDAIRLRLLVNERHSLLKLMTRASNRIEQMAYSLDPAFGHHKTALMHLIRADTFDLTRADMIERAASLSFNSRRTILKLIDALPASYEPDKRIVAMIQRTASLVSLYDDQIAQIEPQILAIIAQHPATSALKTIPFVSNWLIAAMLVVCNGNFRLMTRAEFVRACGVSPNTASSGNSKRTMATPGYKPAKYLIHLATVASLKGSLGDPYIRAIFYRGKSEGARKPLFQAKRRLTELCYVVATSGQPYDRARREELAAAIATSAESVADDEE